jgi:hypothetical protein
VDLLRIKGDGGVFTRQVDLRIGDTAHLFDPTLDAAGA